MPEPSKRPLMHSVMKRAAEHLIPFQVSLEVTHRCNLACKHCYIDTTAGEELSLAELKHILDQLVDSGTMYLLLTGGEPLSRRDFFDVAFYARERGLMLMLLTNGTLINPGIAEKIKTLEPVSIGLSLYGATPDTHDSITGKQGSFASTIHAIELLKRAGLMVTFQTLLMDSNIHEAEAIKNLAQRLEVYHRFGYEFVPTRSGSLAPYQYEADFTRLCHYFDHEWAEDAEQSEGSRICKAGKGMCSISPTGDVFPCLLMPMKVGNLREASFAEIWRTNPSPELTYLRSITRQDLSVCRDCNLARFCRICMGVAFAETGKLTEPAPSTCRNTALKVEFLKRKGVKA